MDQYDEMKKLLENAEADFKKFFEDENNSAGTRVRKCMQEVKRLAQEIRTAVTEKRKV